MGLSVSIAALPLGTVVLNSRDWHEKITTEVYAPQNTP